MRDITIHSPGSDSGALQPEICQVQLACFAAVQFFFFFFFSSVGLGDKVVDLPNPGNSRRCLRVDRPERSKHTTYFSERR